MPLTGAVAEHFLSQAESCRQLGSPFTARLCERLAALLDRESALGRRVADWPGDVMADAVALRLCGGLHALARSRCAPALAAVYPPATGWAEGLGFDAALLGALGAHDGALGGFLDSAPQTNEVARSGILLGGLLTVAARTGLPLDLFEIGSSAGLNLWPDRYRYRLGRGRSWGDADASVVLSCEWRGRAPRLDAPLAIVGRRGSDLAPIDAGNAAARTRLLAFTWPDQPARLATTEAALELAARAPVPIERADAADWVEALLRRPPSTGRARVLMHSVMWQYLPVATRHRIEAMMARAGADAGGATPLAWLRLESDGNAGSAAILLDLWPTQAAGGASWLLGRGDWHGRWAEWAEA